MRNITRWLLNRYGKQRELLRYKPSEDYTRWVCWPKNLIAPTKADMDYIDSQWSAVGKIIRLNNRLHVTTHHSCIWYYDGIDCIVIAAILFPDGTEWEYAPT